MPEISVVIPFKDYVPEFRESIRSVLSQTWTDFELILVDNHASVEARTVAEDARRKDGRVRIVKEEIPGAASARNAGIRHSEGVYVALLDSDDLMKPERLEIQRNALRNNSKVTLVGSFKEEISHEGRLVNACDRPSMPFWASILFKESNLFFEPQTSTFFFRREDALRAGLFDTRYDPFNWSEDTDFALKLYLLGSIFIVPEVLVSLRLHSRDIARKRERDLSGIRNLDLFYRTLLQLVESGCIESSSGDLRIIRSRWLRESGLKYLHYRSGIEAGRSLVRRALEAYPWGFHNVKAYLRTCVPGTLLPKSLGYEKFYEDDIALYTEPGYVRDLFAPWTGSPGNGRAGR
jgi:glycosyltransferase involved in cell wall biosynthesis